MSELWERLASEDYMRLAANPHLHGDIVRLVQAELTEKLAGMREIAAHLAEITIAILPHGGDYRAEEVNELLARQREIIAKRIREAM